MFGFQQFVKRLKTENVDVDSRGRSCKERMVSCVHEDLSSQTNFRCVFVVTISLVNTAQKLRYITEVFGNISSVAVLSWFTRFILVSRSYPVLSWFKAVFG